MVGDHALKLTRADEHLESLRTEIQWWAASHPYRITRERDEDSGFTVFYAEPFGEPPLKLSLIIGDILGNLRSCLDYLAQTLSVRGFGGPLSEGAERACHFPICESQKTFAEARRSVIPRVEAAPLAAIERLQPYHRGKDRESDPLAILKTLSDFDKHRRLPLIAQRAALGAADVLATEWSADEFELTFPSVFEAKTELFRSRGLTDRTGSEVEVDFSLTLDVAFADGAPRAVAGERVIAVMETLWRHVAEHVVLALQSYLE